MIALQSKGFDMWNITISLFINIRNGFFKFDSFKNDVELFNASTVNQKASNQVRDFVSRLLPKHVNTSEMYGIAEIILEMLLF